MVYIAQQRPIQGLYARYCCGVIRRQYIPHIVRSLYLWCQQPVCQTDSRSMRLRTPVWTLSSQRKLLYYIFTAIYGSGIVSRTYEKSWQHSRCIDSIWSGFIEEIYETFHRRQSAFAPYVRWDIKTSKLSYLFLAMSPIVIRRLISETGIRTGDSAWQIIWSTPRYPS